MFAKHQVRIEAVSPNLEARRTAPSQPKKTIKGKSLCTDSVGELPRHLLLGESLAAIRFRYCLRFGWALSRTPAVARCDLYGIGALRQSGCTLLTCPPSKYPPAEPVALRLLAPQRGLFATVRSKSKNKSKSLVLLSSPPQHRQFEGEHTPGILKVLLPPRQSRGISLSD